MCVSAACEENSVVVVVVITGIYFILYMHPSSSSRCGHGADWPAYLFAPLGDLPISPNKRTRLCTVLGPLCQNLDILQQRIFCYCTVLKDHMCSSSPAREITQSNDAI